MARQAGQGAVNVHVLGQVRQAVTLGEGPADHEQQWARGAEHLRSGGPFDGPERRLDGKFLHKARLPWTLVRATLSRRKPTGFIGPGQGEAAP